MTTCKQCENHVDVDMNLDTNAIIRYSSKSPHYCNYFKRPLSVHEATEVIYRTRCEGFKDGRMIPKEEAQMKNSVDWEFAAKLVEEVREQKKFLEFCGNVETAQVVVKIAENKAWDGESITLAIPSELILPVVIEHLKAEHRSTLEALKSSALAEIVKE